MTISEMHNYIKFEVNKTSSLILPAFVPEEIDYCINSSIEEEVNSIASKVLEKPYRTIPRGLDSINTLIETSTISATSNTSIDANGYSISNPSDYLYFISARATIDVDSEDKVVPVRQTPYDLVGEELANPYGHHVLRLGEAKPLMFEDNEQFMLITDGNYSVENVIFTYLRTPAVVDYENSIDCDLPETLHLNIVKRAAGIMLENIQSERYQTHRAEEALVK